MSDCNIFTRYDDIPRGAYDVVLTDCPWLYDSPAGQMGAAVNHYACLDNAALIALNPAPLLVASGVCFVWATGPMLAQAVHLIEAWGLHFRGVAFVWVKTSKEGKPIGAAGVRPTVTKPLTEFVLVASKKRKGRPRPLASEAIVQTVFASRGAHSVKPAEVHARIEALFPPCARLEMFARRTRAGWDAFGDEVEAEPHTDRT